MDSEQQSKRTGWSYALWAAITVTLAAGGVYFWCQNDFIAIAFLIAMVLASVTGFRVGAIKQFAFMGGLVCAYYLAPAWGDLLQANVEEHFGIGGTHARLICIGILAHIITLSVAILVQLGTTGIFRRWPLVLAWNKRAGMCFGAFQGAALMVALIGGVLTAEPLARQEVDTVRPGTESDLSRQVIELADKTRESTLGRFLARLNPFERLPALQEMQAEVEELAQSQQLAELLRKATNKDLRGKPHLRRTVDRLRRDPQVNRIMRSGKTVDAEATKELLSNPIVSRVFSDQDLASEVAKLLEELKSESASDRQPRSRGR